MRGDVRRLVCIFAFFVFTLNGVWSDTIRLTNGNELTGRIVSQDENSVLFETKGGKVPIPQDSIESIEEGVSLDFELWRARKRIDEAKKLIARGKHDEARQVLEDARLDLQAAVDELGTSTPEIDDLFREIDSMTTSAVDETDAESQLAEELYQQALKRLDHIDYQGAYDLLQEAVSIKPDRADIQFVLGETAQRLNESDVAIAAFRASIEARPQTYYDQASRPLLRLLHSKGRRLLAERRSLDAIEVYEVVILLQGTDGKEEEPQELSEFLAKRAVVADQPREEVLMEVFSYADDNDLIDLAFAAVSRAEEINPDNPQIKRLSRETALLANINRALDEGDIDKVADLITGADTDLTESDRVSEKIKKLAGEQARAIAAETLLKKVTQAFDNREYQRAIDLAEELLVEFAQEAAAVGATDILTAAKRELPIGEALDEVEKFIDRGRDDRAEQVLREIETTLGVQESIQLERYNRLVRQIPRERAADELWLLAQNDLDVDEFDSALARLEHLRNTYNDTRSGKRAAEWLVEYRRQLVRESQKYQPRETDFFPSITDPSLWRAARYDVDTERRIVERVAENERSPIVKAFQEFLTADINADVDERSKLLYLVLPFTVGIFLIGGVFWKIAKPGKGRFIQADDLSGDAATGASSVEVETLDGQIVCRMCGLSHAPDLFTCPSCGATRAQTNDEMLRTSHEVRKANFDGWDARVKDVTLNDFNKYFAEAEELSETSDVQAAIDKCRQALEEDPKSIKGYSLLAELYDRAQNHEKAIEAYREILLLDPGDNDARAKLEVLLQVPPLRLGKEPYIVSAGIWWTIFFIMSGLDPGAYVLRLSIAIGGTFLSGFLITQLLKKNSSIVRFHSHARSASIEGKHQIPSEPLSWREQNTQAVFLARSIGNHLGVSPPVLTMNRVFLAVGLSFMLLIGTIGISWYNNYPLVLLAWPVGSILFFYLLEFRPRLETAHLFLRHLLEETMSTWADPHRPFEPTTVEPKPNGEFLMKSRQRLVWRWAVNPYPYGANRQGILNSIQQTLNRHWDFHRFYDSAAVVRETDVPMPAGKTIWNTSVVLVSIVSFLSVGWLAYSIQRTDTLFERNMTIGFQYLLDGDTSRSRDYFVEASQLLPQRVAPDLYLAHAYSAEGLEDGAERHFVAAVEGGLARPESANDYANFLQRQGRLREAIQQYRYALEHDQNNASILNNAGSAYYKLQDYRAAVELLELATAIEPNHTRAFTTLGLCLEEMNRIAEARTAYERAVEVAPNVEYTRIAKQRLEVDLAPEDETRLQLPSLDEDSEETS